MSGCISAIKLSYFSLIGDVLSFLIYSLPGSSALGSPATGPPFNSRLDAYTVKLRAIVETTMAILVTC